MGHTPQRGPHHLPQLGPAAAAPDLRRPALREGRHMTNSATSQITIDVHLPPGGPLSGMAADVRAGLTKPFKELSPKYFYDGRGSELFEQITRLPEYYPTRAERSILEARSGEVAERTHASTLVELGSGSSEKTHLLLQALRDLGSLRTYIPVDVSPDAIQ